MPTITRLLVANRAEIASRVFRTCRRLGIETVAVHSDADADLPYVAEADAAVRLPGSSPAETYLRGDLLVEAARAAGADAIHPGYGFLSENAGFAGAVLDAGLTWVGPDPESIEQMGSKVEAKKLMEAAGVPVLRSWAADELSGGRAASASEPSGGRAASASEPPGGRAASASERVETPLLVKASAGGGGRGMRVVRRLEDLAGEVAAAEAEAASAFGDGTVFVEPYVERGRHVEVQVWADANRNVSVLGERDCSVQRRHQKVVEEAPAPDLSPATREAMHEAARAAAEAIGYRGAGTVEFLHDPERDRFFFLEMNTRLQVEHPVTECVTGLDLVELQIEAAEGPRVVEEGLHVRAAASPARSGPSRDPRGLETGASAPSSTSGETQPRGHAIEVRLYAEDPGAGYQPQSGLLTAFDVPGVSASFERLPGWGLRLDPGFVAGNEVSTHYDAMLAKVISWAPTREQAARQLAGALARARLHGLVTNRDQLVAILRDPVFLEAQMTTTWLDGDPLADAGPSEVDLEAAATAAALAVAAAAAARRTVQGGIPAAWRNVTSQAQSTTFERPDGQELTVAWWGTRDGFAVEGHRVVAVAPDSVTLETDGVRTTYAVALGGAPTREVVDVDSPRGHVRLRRVPRFTDPAEAVSAGSLLAPMPGTVVQVAVAQGARVEAGQTVLVLEAMKMQHTVAAPTAGTVTELPVSAGHQVAAGEVLAVVADPSTEEEA